MAKKNLFDLMDKITPDVGKLPVVTQALCGALVILTCVIGGAGILIAFRPDSKESMDKIIAGMIDLAKPVIGAIVGSAATGVGTGNPSPRRNTGTPAPSNAPQD